MARSGVASGHPSVVNGSSPDENHVSSTSVSCSNFPPHFAHAAGASAIVIPERRAVGLTESVARAAAGALAYVPIVKVTNINRSLEALKDAGYWIYGLDERGDHTYDKVDFTAPTAIVLGGEGKGLHEHVAKHCDFLVRIPMPPGGVASLNVSVAAGIMLFEWRRKQ